MANVFGVKLSIDGKVIAKARATKKESGGKASQRAYFAFQEKWIKNNAKLLKTTTFSLVIYQNIKKLVCYYFNRYTITTYFIMKWQLINLILVILTM
jgi:hypothetical protein